MALEQCGRALGRIAVAIGCDREPRQRFDAEPSRSVRATSAKLCANHPASTSSADRTQLRRRERRAKARRALAARRPRALRLQRRARFHARELEGWASAQKREQRLRPSVTVIPMSRALRSKSNGLAAKTAAGRRCHAARSTSTVDSRAPRRRQAAIPRSAAVSRGGLRRAERRAHGDLADPSRATREARELGNVHARDQQHEPRRTSKSVSSALAHCHYRSGAPRSPGSSVMVSRELAHRLLGEVVDGAARRRRRRSLDTAR